MNFELSKVNHVFADFKKQLEDAKVLNEQTIFDYEDKKGNKEARSHIYKLRQSISAIEKVRKAEKSESLAYGKGVDLAAKELTGELREMISVHEEPIKAIEDREKQRISLIKLIIDKIKLSSENVFETSAHARHDYKSIKDIVIDDSYGEFKQDAELAKYKALESIEEQGKLLKEKEEKQQQLDRIEKEKAEKEKAENERIAEKKQKEREKQITIEATQRVEREAKQREHNAEQKRIAELQRIERETKEAAEVEERKKQEEIARLQQEKQEAIDKAEREKQEAINAERARIQREREERERIERETKEAEEARQADVSHRRKINKAILEGMNSAGLDDATAKNIIKMIVKKQIPNISINY